MSEIYMFHKKGFLKMSLENGSFKVSEKMYNLDDVELKHAFTSKAEGLEYMSERAGIYGFDIGELR